MSLKKIVAVPAGLFIALAAAVIIFITTYDFNQLKPLAVRLVKEATGRDLTIGGKINFKLRLDSGLTIGDVHLQNAPWGSQSDMLTVKRLDVRVGLIPLLARRVRLKRLVFIEPDILIERNKQGEFNFAMNAPDRDKKTARPTGENAGFSLSVGRIRIEKGRMSYRDATAPRP